MATEIEKTPLEPYIGPVPFETKDEALFFGRDFESDELLSLAVAHPVVLMYAQSGAGKTSLLNANLIPKLRKEGYEILPTARVQGTDCGPRTNIYVFNTLMSWSDGALTGDQMLKTTLKDFLDPRAHQKNNVNWELPRFVIFDQFEELFTAYPQRWQERKDFFIQIHDALEADYLLRVIFAMREDYIAELDAYASLLPEKLRTRFRLGRPREKAALAAITKPLQVVKTNRRFADGVAEKLVHNLMMIPSEDGEGEATVGQFVEPVQLQVVCQSLWRNLGPQDDVITFKHLEHCGDVNRALGAFYEQCLAEAIGKTAVRESELRNWFGNTLITLDGTRGMAFRGPERTGEMLNSVVDVMQKLHLIKEEKRGRSRWYELAHDRFIDPIRKSNETWWGVRAGAVETRQRLEARARDWARLGRGSEALLDEAELLEADRWLNSSDAVDLAPTETVLALISASRAEIRERAEAVRQAQMLSVEQARRLRQQRVGLVAMILLVMAMGVLTVYAFRQRAIAKGLLKEVDRQRAEAVTQRGEAVTQRGEAVEQRDRANEAQKEAVQLREVAENLRSHAEAETTTARAAELSAQRARAHAIAQKAIADTTRVESEKQKRLAQSHDLSAIAHKQLSNDPEVSILLAREAVNKTFDSDGTATESAAEALHTAIQAFRKKDNLSLGTDNPNLFRAAFLYRGAFAPDGTRLVGIGSDGSIKIWESFGKAVKTLSGPTKSAYPITFSQDGKILISASSDRSLLLWDVEAGTVLDRTSDTSKMRIIGLALSPTGKLVALSSTPAGRELTTEVRIWDLSARRFSPSNVVVPAGFERLDIRSVALSPDGKTVAFGGYSPAIKRGFTLMLDPATGMSPEAHRGIQWDDSSAVTFVSFSSNGKRVAAANRAGAVKVWELQRDEATSQESFQESFQLCKPTPPETILNFSPDLEYAVSASTGDRVKVRRLRQPVIFHQESKTEVRPEEVTLVGHSSPIVRAAFTTHGSLLTISENMTCTVWDLLSGHEVANLTGSWVGEVAGIAFSPDGKRLAAAIADSAHPKVEIWEGTKRVLTLSGHTQKVWGVVFNREGTRIATSSSDGTVKIWNATTGELQKTLSGHKMGVRELAMNREGTRLVTGGEDGTAKIWDVDSGRELSTLKGHKDVVWGVAFSPDGRHVATASGDKTAKVWDIESSKEVFTLQHGDQVWKVAFSPDGKRIATASHDGTAKIWDARTKELLLTLVVGDQLWGVSFSPDGTRIATASSDKTARIWDANSGRQLLVLTGHSSAVNRAVFSPDSRHLATSSEDRTVRVYTLDIAELVALSRQRVPRELTPEERKLYLRDR